MDAADPDRLVRGALGRADLTVPRFVVAAGKAAVGMMTAATEAGQVHAAVVAAPVQAPRSLPPAVEYFEAGHPSPNQASVDAGDRALSLAHRSRSDGGLLVLLSGGASALLVAPVPGVTRDEKVETARKLMNAGAAIHELNCVRKHLSRIKGGQLAVAAGSTVTFALSDVHGPVADDPSVIGSGPTVADDTTYHDALAVIGRYRVDVPPNVLAHLERGARGDVPETLKPGDPRAAGSVYTVIGNRRTAVDGARQAAERRGYHVIELDAATTGEAREAGRAFVAEAGRKSSGASRPICVVGSGETTVTVTGNGMGGRNQEFVLATAADLASNGGAIVLASTGTDGIDGPTDAAGAIVDATTLDRARRLGLDWQSALSRNDAYHFFEPLGDLIRWGPTGTNVGDLHVLLMA